MVSLHHLANPTWFTLKGGWANKNSPEIFNNYVKRIVNELGKDIDYWLTINEPNTYVLLGYFLKILPPLKINPFAGFKAAKNMFKAHKFVYETIKLKYPSAKVGTTTCIQLFTDDKGRTDGTINKLLSYLVNYVFLDKISQSSDFIGLNYYFPLRLFHLNKIRKMNWEIYPKGIYDAIKETRKRYHKTIIVTENGIADETDEIRANYIKDHLKYIHKAIQEGVDIRGYIYWSLTDNFELAEGFGPKFGLIKVNLKTQEREIKNSARYYAKFCKNNCLDEESTPEMLSLIEN